MKFLFVSVTGEISDREILKLVSFRNTNRIRSNYSSCCCHLNFILMMTFEISNWNAQRKA